MKPGVPLYRSLEPLEQHSFPDVGPIFVEGCGLIIIVALIITYTFLGAPYYKYSRLGLKTLF